MIQRQKYSSCLMWLVENEILLWIKIFINRSKYNINESQPTNPWVQEMSLKNITSVICGFLFPKMLFPMLDLIQGQGTVWVCDCSMLDIFWLCLCDFHSCLMYCSLPKDISGEPAADLLAVETTKTSLHQSEGLSFWLERNVSPKSSKLIVLQISFGKKGRKI